MTRPAKITTNFDPILSMKMAILFIFYHYGMAAGYFYDRIMRREIQNPQMFETDSESFSQANYLEG
jgi:hypothetical protein